MKQKNTKHLVFTIGKKKVGQMFTTLTIWKCKLLFRIIFVKQKVIKLKLK